METALRHLQLPAETMRKLAYRAVDLIIEHQLNRTEQTPVGGPIPAERRVPLQDDLPEEPTPIDQVIEQAYRDVLSDALHADHPLNFGRIPGPAAFVPILGDMLAAGFNACPISGTVAPGATRLETMCAEWLATAIGLAPQSGGIFVSGGSIANLMAVVLARDKKAGNTGSLAAYCSDQTHPSVRRALRIAGLPETCLRIVPADAAFRLSPTRLHEQIAADRRAGKEPFLLVANAGTTNTGAVDPLRELSNIAAGEGLWFHVDGAFGVAAAMGNRAAKLFDGIANADSVTFDPHKWLFQPYAISCLLLRSPACLQRSFYLTDVYLEEDHGDSANLGSWGPELTRPFRALKLWMTLKCHGMAAIRAAIDHGIVLAEYAAQAVRNLSDLRIVTPPSLAVLTFAYHAPGMEGQQQDDLHEWISRTLIAEGRAVVFCTTVYERRVLRLCTINPLTTEAGIDTVLRRIVELGRSRCEVAA